MLTRPYTHIFLPTTALTAASPCWLEPVTNDPRSRKVSALAGRHAS